MRWKAIDAGGRSICTVPITQGADESDEQFLERARARVKDLLCRPGRRGYYDAWVAGGHRIYGER